MTLSFILLAALAGPSIALPPTEPSQPPLLLQRGRELLKNTELFMGRTVVVADGYCFYDQPNFVCIGSETPFEVKAPSMPNGPIRTAIESNCGDIQGTEHNPVPDCAYSFRFVLRSYKAGIGDYIVHDRVQSNKRLIFIESDSVEALTK